MTERSLARHPWRTSPQARRSEPRKGESQDTSRAAVYSAVANATCSLSRQEDLCTLPGSTMRARRPTREDRGPGRMREQWGQHASSSETPSVRAMTARMRRTTMPKR